MSEGWAERVWKALGRSHTGPRENANVPDYAEVHFVQTAGGYAMRVLALILAVLPFCLGCGSSSEVTVEPVSQASRTPEEQAEFEKAVRALQNMPEGVGPSFNSGDEIPAQTIVAEPNEQE